MSDLRRTRGQALQRAFQSTSAFRQELRRAFRRLVKTSDAFNSLVASLSTLLAIFGTGVSSGAISPVSLPLASAPFPVRLTIFLIVAFGLGWMLGSLANLSRPLASQTRLIFVGLAALCLAGLVGGVAEWLFPVAHQSGPIPLKLVMILIGALTSVRATAVHFDAGFGAVGRVELRLRAMLMLVFTAGVALIVMLGEIGVR